MTRTRVPAITLLAMIACGDADSGTSTQQASTPDHPIEAFAPSSQERYELMETVQRFFDALEAGDADLLRSVMDPSVVMHSTETRNGLTTFGSSTVDGLARRIASSDTRLIERMWDPIVAVNGSFAMLWTPYDLYSGATFSHCGVDAVHLMNTEDGWRIVGMSWTKLQPPACDLHPGGPPITG